MCRTNQELPPFERIFGGILFLCSPIFVSMDTDLHLSLNVCYFLRTIVDAS